MKKKILLSLLLVGMLTSCGGDNDPSTSTSSNPASETPSVSVDTGTSTSDSTPLPNAITDISVANSVPGTYSIKGVVVGVTSGSFLVKDATGVVMVYIYPSVPTVDIGDYVLVKGASVARYANCQFDSTATVEVLTEEAPDVSETPTPLTKDYWNSYDGKIGKLVSGTVLLHEEGGRMYFKYEDCEMLGQFSYPDPSVGFTAENVGRFADFVGYMLDTSTSTPNKHNVLLTSFDLVDITSTGVEIIEPITTTVEVGATLMLKSVVLPEGTDQNVTWSSSAASVATVDDLGVVRGVDVGTATITATSVFDDTKTDELEITIVAPTAKNYVAIASYDFSSISSTSNAEITKEAVFNAFVSSLSTGDQIVTSVVTSKVYQAHLEQGPKVGGLKFGTGTAPAMLIINLEENVRVSRVELQAYNWNDSSADNKISINYSTAQIPATSGSTLIFDVTTTNEIRMDVINRTVLQSIIFYAEVV